MTVGARDFIDKLLVEKYAQEKVDNHDDSAYVSKVSANDVYDAMTISANNFKTGEKLEEPCLHEKITCLKKHSDDEIEYRGLAVGIKFFRKFYPYYISKTRNASVYRAKLVPEDNYDNIMEILKMEILIIQENIKWNLQRKIKN